MESFEERPVRKQFHNIHSTKIIDREQSLNFTNNPQSLNSAVFSPVKITSTVSFHQNIFVIQ